MAVIIGPIVGAIVLTILALIFIRWRRRAIAKHLSDAVWTRKYTPEPGTSGRPIRPPFRQTYTSQFTLSQTVVNPPLLSPSDFSHPSDFTHGQDNVGNQQQPYGGFSQENPRSSLSGVAAYASTPDDASDHSHNTTGSTVRLTSVSNHTPENPQFFEPDTSDSFLKRM